MFQSADNLKNVLQTIKANKYIIPSEIDLDSIIKQMLNNIGNPDPVLRDELIYSIFATLLIKSSILNEKLPEIINIILDDSHLFYKLGEVNTDTVFTRSFSALLIPPLLINHRKNNILKPHDIINIYEKVTKYFIEEKDLRGYIPGKGWAHSIAHTADALDDIALCEEIGLHELLFILAIIQQKVLIENYLFIDGEDERMVTAIVSILSRSLVPIEQFRKWIVDFRSFQPSKDYILDNTRKNNCKNFLRSLYFRLLSENYDGQILSELISVLEALQKMH